MTRRGLLDGSLMEIARTRSIPGYRVWSDEEISASLQATLNDRPRGHDLWVFAYGSLMWNPTVEYIERRPAALDGWHRSLCLLTAGRGTLSSPGLMLALEPGGRCDGIMFRFDESAVDHELLILWRQEMLIGAYEARWVTARQDGRDVPALTFVANRAHPRFVRDLSETEIAARVAFARGPAGRCHEYLVRTLESLREIGATDAALEAVGSRVNALLAAPA